MIFHTLLIFLPASGCLFWILFNSMAAGRTSTYRIVLFLLLDLLVYFITDSCYADPSTKPQFLVYTSILAQFAAPCIIPLLMLYFAKLEYHTSFRPAHYVWLVAPIILLTAAIALTDVCGKEETAAFLDDIYSHGPSAAKSYRGDLLESYYIWTAVAFRVILGLEFVAAVLYMLRFIFRKKVSIRHLYGFISRGEQIRFSELQLFNLLVPAVLIVVKISFLRSFLTEHVWFSILLSLLMTGSMFIFAYCALLGEREKITLMQLRHAMVYNYNNSSRRMVAEELMEYLMEDAGQDTLQRLRERIGKGSRPEAKAPQELSAVKEKLFQTMASSWEDSLLTRFQTLLLNDQLFLKPSLSLSEVAERLRTNKTYVSKMVNNAYDMSFPELLNILRIDYAQQYIVSHPHAKQTEIAHACGFLRASAFNNMFKRVTGVTPKTWLATRGTD